jgi:hypothetical protein
MFLALPRPAKALSAKLSLEALLLTPPTAVLADTSVAVMARYSSGTEVRSAPAREPVLSAKLPFTTDYTAKTLCELSQRHRGR